MLIRNIAGNDQVNNYRTGAISYYLINKIAVIEALNYPPRNEYDGNGQRSAIAPPTSSKLESEDLSTKRQDGSSVLSIYV